MPETVPRPTSARSHADWERIEREYRAGQFSVSEIGRLCGVSHTAINKRAKKHGWARNLTARVREEVSARLVAEEVSPETTREAIDVAASRGVELVRSHRQDIRSSRDMFRALLGELQGTTAHHDEIDMAIEDEKDGKRRVAMHRAVSLPSRSRVMLDLAGALKTLVGLERQAFNIDEPVPPAPPGATEQNYAGLAAAEAYRRMKDGEG